MARSIGTTVVFAAILLTPLVASLGYLALDPATEVPAATVAPTPASVAPAAVAAPAPVVPAPAEFTKVIEPVAPVEPAAAVEPAVPVEPVAAVEPDQKEARPVLATGEALLMHADELVLATTPSLSWGKGPMKVDPIDSGYAVHREVALERLPASLPCRRVVDGFEEAELADEALGRQSEVPAAPRTCSGLR